MRIGESAAGYRELLHAILIVGWPKSRAIPFTHQAKVERTLAARPLSGCDICGTKNGRKNAPRWRARAGGPANVGVGRLNNAAEGGERFANSRTGETAIRMQVRLRR